MEMEDGMAEKPKCEYPHKKCHKDAVRPNALAKDDRICLCDKHADMSAMQWAQNSC